MASMISFIAGLLVGGTVGVVVAALCAASAKNPAKVFTEEADPGIQADYKRLYENLMDLPNCNDCASVKDCPYRPEWGGTARVNCPLHTMGGGGLGRTPTPSRPYTDPFQAVHRPLPGRTPTALDRAILARFPPMQGAESPQIHKTPPFSPPKGRGRGEEVHDYV